MTETEQTAELLKVTVERSKWGRGNGSTNSYLFNPQDKLMCCLGFAGLAAGVTLGQMSSQTEFNETLLAPKLLKGLVINLESGFPSEIAYTLMAANDAPVNKSFIYHNPEKPLASNDNYRNDSKTFSSETEREAFLTEKGKLAGIDFHFVD